MKVGKSYTQLRDEAISSLTNYMNSLDESQGKKLAYWVQDYVRFLKQERTFDPKKLLRYKRGAIVKVHLGYRIGSEEGGLHYAIVLDSHNALSSPTVTVIPLTSVKETTDIKRLHYSNVYLGKEIYKKVFEKSNNEVTLLLKQIEELRNQSAHLSSKEDEKVLDDQILKAECQVHYCKKISDEIKKMKTGSIALVGQIVTISKQRIYDPLYSKDALSNICVSDDTLDKLDQKVHELFGPA